MRFAHCPAKKDGDRVRGEETTDRKSVCICVCMCACVCVSVCVRESTEVECKEMSE